MDDTATNPADRLYQREGRTVPFGHGAAWIGDAWTLFTQAPLTWILALIAFAVVFTLLNFVPLLGSLLGCLLYAIAVTGWLKAADVAARGGVPEPGDFLAGFQQRTGELITLSVIYTACVFGILLVMGTLMLALIGVSGVLDALLSGDPAQIAATLAESALGLLIVSLVAMALMIPVFMGMWFAPALVYFHGEPPMRAFVDSFMLCARNLLPFLLYGLVMLVLSIIASLPLMLGFLIVGPLYMLSLYTTYRDVFLAPAENPTAGM